MKAVIADVTVRLFRTRAKTAVDGHGHRHPAPDHEVQQALFSITDSDGVSGHVLAKPGYVRPDQVERYLRPTLLGADAMMHEKVWDSLAHQQRGRASELPDHTLSYVDQAVWDLIGVKLGVPVWQLLGGARDRVQAYASTMCGDDIPGGLRTPEDYAAFAQWLVERGYRAIKLHTWMPPVPGAPSPERDIRACAAVREAVGPDIRLMLDSNHWYSRTESLQLGRALEKLDFYWIEEPMDEYSIQSYKWLADQLDIPVIGPEVAAGKHHTRAEWAIAGACDILRVGAMNAGGLTPAMKAVHVAQGFGMDCEIHGNGAANLSILGAMTNARWYERGLLHPHVDHEEVPPHLVAIDDPMDSEGWVAMPSEPGLGAKLNLDYILDATIESW